VQVILFELSLLFGLSLLVQRLERAVDMIELQDVMYSLAMGVFAAIVAVIATVAIEKLGGVIGGVIRYGIDELEQSSSAWMYVK
jgi:hypothetical protein